MFRPLLRLFSFLPRLWSNWITLLGTVVVSMSAVTVLAALAIDFTSAGLNSYASVILFLVMPGVMGLGLLLIPVGLLFERRRARTAHAPADPESPLPVLTRLMQNPTVRARVGFVALMTVLNVLIFSTVTYRAVEFMETPSFCGNVCHRVMQPEHDAHATSPHSQVACVQCHIGSGASSAVKAKMNGLHQVWGALTGNFNRPIKTPVHNLRPATETCGNCHSASRQSGTRVGFRVHFKPDEANTPQVTAMTFNVGGEDPRTGQASGIHWHASPSHQVRFEVLDDKRQIIGKIQTVENGKVVKEWLPPKGQQGTVHATRTMDCTDCHNRAAHIYDGTPEQAVTRALVDGRLDRKVPWLYQEAVGVLGQSPPPREQAETALRQALDAAFARDHASQMPEAAQLDAAARTLAELYRRNVYPEMHLAWNSYPSEVGHGGPDPGPTKAQCFRCHNSDHQTAAGEELSSKCELCHEVVAKDELPADLPDELRPLLHMR